MRELEQYLTRYVEIIFENYIDQIPSKLDKNYFNQIFDLFVQSDNDIENYLKYEQHFRKQKTFFKQFLRAFDRIRNVF
jgi:hypothetical protein